MQVYGRVGEGRGKGARKPAEEEADKVNVAPRVTATSSGHYVSSRALWLKFYFSCVCIFWDEKGGGTTPVGPQVDKTTIGTVLSTNRVDLGSFSSRCYTFRRTHTSADPIRLLCIRLALPLTFSLPSRFSPSARLVVCVSPRALWLAGIFSCRKKTCAGVVGKR